MFKNIIAYKIKPEWSAAFGALESQLQKHLFVPCGPTTVQTSGWVPPRGQAHGPLVESINGSWILKLAIESKSVPGSVVKRAVKERLELIEATTGRKPGKKETRSLKDEVMLDLLPKAFAKMETISVCINPEDKFVLVGAGSLSKSDSVIGSLVHCLDDFGVDLLATKTSPQSAMCSWLSGTYSPAYFEIGQEVELKGLENKSVVKYSSHNLEIDEIKAHIKSGKVATKLELEWNGRVKLTITDTLAIKKFTCLDVVFEDGQDEKDDAFDADMTIFTSEMDKLLPNLIEALGGEMTMEQTKIDSLAVAAEVAPPAKH